MGDISKDIQSTFPNNKIKALINIKYTANWLKKNDVELFKVYDISPQQFNILRILRGADKGIRAQDIKERMIEKSPNTTRLMDKLYDKKLIVRTKGKEDGRIIYISISPKGLKLLVTIGDSVGYDFLDNFTEEEAIQLSCLLDKLR